MTLVLHTCSGKLLTCAVVGASLAVFAVLAAFGDVLLVLLAVTVGAALGVAAESTAVDEEQPIVCCRYEFFKRNLRVD